MERVTVGGAFIDHYARGKGKIRIEQECPNHKVALELILSGLQGITEKFTYRRDIRISASKGDWRAELCIDMEAYRLKKYIGSYYAVLGRMDAVVFTVGVGELSHMIRERVLTDFITAFQ